MLGPVQYILLEDVAIIFSAHHIQYHIFAYDQQMLASAPVTEAPKTKKKIEKCHQGQVYRCASCRLRLINRD